MMKNAYLTIISILVKFGGGGGGGLVLLCSDDRIQILVICLEQ